MTTTTKKLTAKEFLALDLDDELNRYELLEGEIVLMNPPKSKHSTRQSDLMGLFFLYELRHPEFRAVVEPGLRLSPEEVCRPDLIVLLEPQRGGRCIEVDDLYTGPPEIVVEVLSSRPMLDLVRKRNLYAQAQIPEYWIFSPDENQALFLHLENGVYKDAAVLREGFYQTPRLPGFRLDVAALFRRDVQALAAALTLSG